MRISDWSSDVCSSDLWKHRESGHSNVEDAGNRTPGEAFRIRCRFAILGRKFVIFHVRRGSRPQWRLLMARRGLPHALLPALNAFLLGPLRHALGVCDKRLSLAAATNKSLNSQKACSSQYSQPSTSHPPPLPHCPSSPPI